MEFMVFIIIIIAVFLSGALLAAFVAGHFYNKKESKIFETMLLKLDRVLGGSPPEISYNELAWSAIDERLERLAYISQDRKEKAASERDAIKSLVSDISHQVRTPLANIMLYSGLLYEKELDIETRLLASKIHKQAGKLDFFMKELVKSSYTSQQMVTLHPEMTEIEEIINISCQETELAALKKNIRIEKDMPGGLCYADKKWSIEALANILENAIKYSPENSLVKIQTATYDSFICVSVEDEGMGINEEEQGLVFERFYRSKDAGKETGFGIGLYIVREVLSKQGGYARIKPAPEKGTIVQMFLSRYPV